MWFLSKYSMLFTKKFSYKFINYLKQANRLDDEDSSIKFFWLTSFTSIFILIICNSIVRNKDTLLNSLVIELATISILSIYFYINSITRNKELGLILIIILITSSLFINILIIYSIMTLSFLSTYKIIKKSNFKNLKNTLKIALVSSLILVISYNSLSPTTFTQYISIINGIGSIDTLYHASVSAMIKNHQTISSGLHGLIYTPYQILSHSIFAGLSAITGISIIESMEIQKWLLLVPMVMYAICSFCEVLIKKSNKNINWVVTALLLSIFPIVLNGWSLWNNYFNSDSYLVSIILLMIGIQRLLKSSYSKYDYLYILVSFLLIISAKGSVGALYLVLSFCGILIININSKKKILGLLCISTFLCFMLVSYYINSIKTINLSFFDFYYKYSVNNIKPFNENENIIYIFNILNIIVFLSAHFSMSLIGIILIIKSKNYNIKYLLFMSIALVLGIISVICLSIPGGSVYYISNISFFIAMPMMILRISSFDWASLNINYYLSLLVIILIFLIQDILEWDRYKKSLLSLESNRNFIYSLINIRNNTNVNSLVIADSSFLKNNTKLFNDWKCIPYIYVAISERPWVNIFNSWGNCNYQDYSSSFYGVNLKNNTPSIPVIEPKISNYVYWP